VTTLATVPLPPARTPEWHAARWPYVGASECAALVGQHGYKTIADLAAEKMAAEPVVTEPNGRMLAGTCAEDGIATRFEERYGLALTRPDVMFVDECHRLAANPDRLLPDGSPLDCKLRFCVPQPLPTYIQWQLALQMILTGAERGFVVALYTEQSKREAVGFEPLRCYELRRTEEAERRLLEAADQFWSYVELRLEPPEPFTYLDTPIPTREIDRLEAL
jgi:predicted phage-related endonuclease